MTYLLLLLPELTLLLGEEFPPGPLLNLLGPEVLAGDLDTQQKDCLKKMEFWC
jgi:hypothetical protein